MPMKYFGHNTIFTLVAGSSVIVCEVMIFNNGIFSYFETDNIPECHNPGILSYAIFSTEGFENDCVSDVDKINRCLEQNYQLSRVYFISP